jgi:hypothetical protein
MVCCAAQLNISMTSLLLLEGLNVLRARLHIDTKWQGHQINFSFQRKKSFSSDLQHLDSWRERKKERKKLTHAPKVLEALTLIFNHEVALAAA